MSNLDDIPCEICNHLIPFDEYIQHVETCYIQTQLSRRSPHRRNASLMNSSTVIDDDTSTLSTVQFIPIEDVGRIIENDLGQFFTFVSSNLPINATLTEFDSNQHNGSVGSLFDTDFQSIVTLLPLFFNRDNNYDFNLNLQDVMGGNVEVGVTNKESCYEIIPFDVNMDQTDQCSICLQSRDDMTTDVDHENGNDITTFVKTTCNHVYCKPCIDKWLSSHHTCPVCIHDFNQERAD